MKLRGLVVFHANRDAFPETNFFTPSKSDRLIELFNEGKFTPVAHLGPKHSKDDAFDLTNVRMNRMTGEATDGVWQDNQEVRVIDPSERKRSTSDGDIILDVTNRRAYAVKSGFPELDVSKMDFDEQLGVAKNLIRRDQHREASLGRSMG